MLPLGHALPGVTQLLGCRVKADLQLVEILRAARRHCLREALGSQTLHGNEGLCAADNGVGVLSSRLEIGERRRCLSHWQLLVTLQEWRLSSSDLLDALLSILHALLGLVDDALHNDLLGTLAQTGHRCVQLVLDFLELRVELQDFVLDAALHACLCLEETPDTLQRDLALSSSRLRLLDTSVGALPLGVKRSHLLGNVHHLLIGGSDLCLGLLDQPLGCEALLNRRRQLLPLGNLALGGAEPRLELDQISTGLDGGVGILALGLDLPGGDELPGLSEGCVGDSLGPRRLFCCSTDVAGG
mmetsp:Transcript_5306/g.12021  ORF Transcript_5306/g.12021 Transcript_5306/m.12021 type:complete len:300 (+) Transcript_5306:3141-4040(+)